MAEATKRQTIIGDPGVPGTLAHAQAMYEAQQEFNRYLDRHGGKSGRPGGVSHRRDGTSRKEKRTPAVAAGSSPDA